MKITFVAPELNMSGGVRVIAIYARELIRRGHDVVVVSQAARPVSRRQMVFHWLKGGSLRKPPSSHFDGLSLDVRRLRLYRPVYDEDLPDADVVVATWWETAESVYQLSPSKGVPVYFIQHHESFAWFTDEQRHRSEATYRLPMRKITIARWLVDLMAERYGDRDVDLVPNAVDHGQFHAPPRGKQARPTIGFLYSTAEFKGVDITLAAIPLIKQKFPSLRIVCFGEGPVPEEWASQLEHVQSPPQHGIRDIYAACDVWVTASRSEGFNLPAMEAMACRTPVVSTRTGWPDEAIVDGWNGWRVNIDDAVALAGRTVSVLEMPDSFWQQMSEAAYLTVKDASWEKATDRFEAALVAAVARGRLTAPVTVDSVMPLRA